MSPARFILCLVLLIIIMGPSIYFVWMAHLAGWSASMIRSAMRINKLPGSRLVTGMMRDFTVPSDK